MLFVLEYSFSELAYSYQRCKKKRFFFACFFFFVVFFVFLRFFFVFAVDKNKKSLFLK